MSHRGLHLVFAALAWVAAMGMDAWLGTRPDDWIHDAAIVHHGRKTWPHVAIVTLDEGVPIQVGRRQSLPLFARATERLIEAGARGVFLDARLSKEQEPVMPYARCLEPDGGIRWSRPKCIGTSFGQCLLTSSQAGISPLEMNGAALARFLIAPYLPGRRELPDFLLYGAKAILDDRPRTAADRLVTKNSAIKRWMDLSPDHAVVRLARMLDSQKTTNALRPRQDNELCDDKYPCRRIRFSRPVFHTQLEGARVIAPLSLLASCDDRIAFDIAARLQGKVIILQMTGPAEASDLVVTPLTTAWLGPRQPTPGAQFLADAIETLLLQDNPRQPVPPVKWILFATMAILPVLIGSYFPLVWVWGLVPVVAGSITGLCFIFPPILLWPVSAALTAYLTGAAQVTGLKLLIGLREGRLIHRYMPTQVHDLLLSTAGGGRFRNRRHRAVVLMSDLANYTTVTGLLKDPAMVLRLMNDYLQETSLVLQQKHQGWLESYVGDMVCYYWPVGNGNLRQGYRNALLGAMELASLQRRFFATLPQRYGDRLPPSTLANLAKIVGAGIGLASGTVVMGDLGPPHGVRKFGILGDPLNLAARLESLTRHFDSHILVDETLISPAGGLDLRYRRLGRFRLKGRITPTVVYALGAADDAHFQKEPIRRWESWLSEVEQDRSPQKPCPDLYARDGSTLLAWRQRGMLRQGVWWLDEK